MLLDSLVLEIKLLIGKGERLGLEKGELAGIAGKHLALFSVFSMPSNVGQMVLLDIFDLIRVAGGIGEIEIVDGMREESGKAGPHQEMVYVATGRQGRKHQGPLA